MSGPERISPAMEMEEMTWGNLPDCVLLGIIAHLPCRADRVRMACVNRLWRAAVTAWPRPPPLPQVPRLPPQLPWLIFPSTRTPTFYSVLGGRSHRLPLPPDVRFARFCGSFDGGWLVLSLDTRHGHALYNLNSGQRVNLPPGLVTPWGRQFPLVVRFATLSSSPSPQAYMAAAIVLVARRLVVAFWSQGREFWFTPRGPRLRRPQDVIYYNDGFYVLTAIEGVTMFWPGYGCHDSNQVVMNRVEFNMLQRPDYLSDMSFVLGNGAMTRYLVESRGHLLMVVRYIYDEEETQVLRVFRFCLMRPSPIGRRPRATWVHLSELEGRVLFLGRGCSRSFETAEFEGLEDSMIHFLDDLFAPANSMAAEQRLYYSFNDIGRYDMLELGYDRWPPEDCRPLRSDRAPPTWWLP